MTRDGYHHGNLRAALVAAGVQLARSGGAAAVGLREATRVAGVSPTAAYRHFANRDDLVLAVAGEALARLAERIDATWASVPHATDPTTRGRDALAVVGRTYIAFALDEPGWFDAAFFSVRDMAMATSPDAAGGQGRTAFQLLQDALADLVRGGALPADRADVAAALCWASVHGFATLATAGPWRSMPRQQLDGLADGVVGRAVAAVVADAPAGQ